MLFNENDMRELINQAQCLNDLASIISKYRSPMLRLSDYISQKVHQLISEQRDLSVSTSFIDAVYFNRNIEKFSAEWNQVLINYVRELNAAKQYETILAAPDKYAILFLIMQPIEDYLKMRDTIEHMDSECPVYKMMYEKDRALVQLIVDLNFPVYNNGILINTIVYKFGLTHILKNGYKDVTKDVNLDFLGITPEMISPLNIIAKYIAQYFVIDSPETALKIHHEFLEKYLTVQKEYEFISRANTIGLRYEGYFGEATLPLIYTIGDTFSNLQSSKDAYEQLINTLSDKEGIPYYANPSIAKIIIPFLYDILDLVLPISDSLVEYVGKEAIQKLKSILDENPDGIAIESIVERPDMYPIVIDDAMEVSIVSEIDPKYKSKGKLALSKFKMTKIDKANILKYKEVFPILSHIRISETSEYLTYLWMDNDKAVAIASVHYNNADGYNWITAIEVSKNYQGYGLGKQVLDYAVIRMHGDALSVNAKNKVAKAMYEKYGFKTSPESIADVAAGRRSCYFMYLDGGAKLKSNKIATEADKSVHKSSKVMHDAQRKVYRAYKSYKQAEDKVDSQVSKVISGAKNLMTGDVRTEIIEGKKFSAMGILKKVLGSAAIFSFSKVAGVLAIVTGFALKKKTTVSERRKILLELNAELEMVTEKIEDARGDGNREAKYALMRTKTEIENAIRKIHLGLDADQKTIDTAKSIISRNK